MRINKSIAMKKKIIKNFKLQKVFKICEKILEKLSIFLSSQKIKFIFKRLMRLKILSKGMSLEKLTTNLLEKYAEMIKESDNSDPDNSKSDNLDPDNSQSDNSQSDNLINYLEKVNVISFFLNSAIAYNREKNVGYCFIKYILSTNFVSAESGSFVSRLLSKLTMKRQKSIISFLKKLRSLNILNLTVNESKKKSYFYIYRYAKKALRKLRKKLKKRLIEIQDKELEQDEKI